MDTLVYSVCNKYFLLIPMEQGKIGRIFLTEGRYMGTLVPYKSSLQYVYNLSPYLYRPHPEYRIAWLGRKNTIQYDMVFYDKSIVSDRFKRNAVTTREDIERVLMKATCVYGIGGTYYAEGRTLQFNRHDTCDYYWNWVE